MAAKENRVLVKLKSTESSHMYYTIKNKRNTAKRIEIKKYDPFVRKHVLYKEGR